MDENPYRSPLTSQEPGPGRPQAAFWPQVYRIVLLALGVPFALMACLWLIGAALSRDMVNFSIGCTMGAIAVSLLYLFRQVRL